MMTPPPAEGRNFREESLKVICLSRPRHHARSRRNVFTVRVLRLIERTRQAIADKRFQSYALDDLIRLRSVRMAGLDRRIDTRQR